MWQVGEGFAENYKNSKISKMVILEGDRKLYDTWEYTGTRHIAFVRDGSSVRQQRQADIRTTASLNFKAFTQTGVEMLEPTSGLEIQMYSGCYVDDVPVWVPVGLVNVEDWSLNGRAGQADVAVTCNDRSSLMTANRRLPYVVNRGGNWYDAMKALALDRARGFVPLFNFGNSEFVTSDFVFSGEMNYWTDALLKLAEGAGAELYFDPVGTLEGLPILSDERRPIVEDYSSRNGGVLITPPSRTMKKSEIVNGVICNGEASWLLYPVSGEVWDDDPTSRTWRYSQFGEHPKTIGDNMAGTDEQCQVAAEAEYHKSAGVIENVSFTTMPDPRKQVGDVVVAWNDWLEEWTRYSLDSIQFSFGLEPMTGTTRTKR